jgi:hypothetical protein
MYHDAHLLATEKQAYMYHRFGHGTNRLGQIWATLAAACPD